MLKVKLLDMEALVPTVAHPGEDIGYDLYSLGNYLLRNGIVTPVKTGISVEASDAYGKPVGLLIKDRSSMAMRGVLTHGGVIDAGYRGPILVLMSFTGPEGSAFHIGAGQKIAQMVPLPVLTGSIERVDQLTEATRGERGFGSSGM